MSKRDTARGTFAAGDGGSDGGGGGGNVASTCGWAPATQSGRYLVGVRVGAMPRLRVGSVE